MGSDGPRAEGRGQSIHARRAFGRGARSGVPARSTAATASRSTGRAARGSPRCCGSPRALRRRPPGLCSIEGEDLAASSERTRSSLLRSEIAWVPASLDFQPGLTVLEQVALAGYLQSRSYARVKRTARAALGRRGSSTARAPRSPSSPTESCASRRSRRRSSSGRASARRRARYEPRPGRARPRARAAARVRHRAGQRSALQRHPRGRDAEVDVARAPGWRAPDRPVGAPLACRGHRPSLAQGGGERAHA